MSRLRGIFGVRKNRYIGAGVAAITIIGSGVAVYLGTQQDATPGSSGGVKILLELHAPRDVGRLPARSGWCTAVRSAEHCWLLQESSGDAIDTGSASPLWDLTPTGSPRQGVVVSLPVADATGFVDTTTERGVWFDGADIRDNALRASSLQNLPNDATNLVSVTAVYTAEVTSDFERIFGAGLTVGHFEIFLNTAGKVVAFAQGPGGFDQVSSVSSTWQGAAAHCVTVVFDGRTANAGEIFVDGTDDTPASPDFASAGSLQSTGFVAMGNYHITPSALRTLTGAVLRARVDYGVALTLAQHQTLCGSLWDFELSAETTKVVAADLTYTQTGGSRCLAQSATTALCVPGGEPAHGWRSGLGLAWMLEPDRTNRILDSFDLSTGNWAGDATTLAVAAPDGSLTAWDVFVDDASSISAVPTGYTASTDLDLGLWLRCSAGNLSFTTDGAAAGEWDVDCSTIAGAWTYIWDNHVSVTETTQFASASTGDATVIVSSDATGVAVQMWMPTLTEVPGLSVIRTEGAALATGTITWTVDNSPAVYYIGSKGKITYVSDTPFTGASEARIFSFGPNPGLHYFLANNNYRIHDSASALVTQCSAHDPSGFSGEHIFRWNSGDTLDGTNYVLSTRGGVQKCTYSGGTWTPASPVTLTLMQSASIGAVQTIRIEDGP